jgi:hypothetical protein
VILLGSLEFTYPWREVPLELEEFAQNLQVGEKKYLESRWRRLAKKSSTSFSNFFPL